MQQVSIDDVEEIESDDNKLETAKSLNKGVAGGPPYKILMFEERQPSSKHQQAENA